MIFPVEWSKFTAAEFTNTKMMMEAEEFEVLLIKDVTKYTLYRDTLFEIPKQYGHKLTEELVNTLLQKYGALPSYNTGSIRALYRQITPMAITA